VSHALKRALSAGEWFKSNPVEFQVKLPRLHFVVYQLITFYGPERKRLLAVAADQSKREKWARFRL
jgi:hypothetical protein